MSIWEILLVIFITLILFAIVHRKDKCRKPVRRACMSMLTGLLSLIAVNITGLFTGITLPFSLLSVLTSVIGGIPGVTMLLALNLYF
ncbi:MAG: pro-sigmaK processing inhibitor BofA family protein [Ruminococcus sp.]|nr:pro-sigmaK processing inhibitor BofA family protein [Ruminococcus sp.]